MENFDNSLNTVPKLLEINLGFPDFRFKSDRIKKISFSQIDALLKALPEGVQNLGIGGSPLRFKWWRRLVGSLSTIKKNVVLVEKVSRVNTSMIKFLKTKGVELFLEVEDLNQIKEILKFQSSCGMFLISLEKIYRDENLLNALERIGVPFNIERITWKLSDTEGEKIRRFLGKARKIDRKCEIIENKVIGLGLDGNFYPCVALQFPDFELGNIFKDNFGKIVENYHIFKRKLKCPYCCQARSWNKYKVLNQDFLCHHQC
jgi:radical SAM protein with 4Fe4S-binding SPASM domain